MAKQCPIAPTTLTGAALVGIDHQKFGVANGTNLTFRTIGGTMGVAMVIAVSGTAGVAGSAAAFHRVFFALFATFALATLVFGLAYPGQITRRAVGSDADRSPVALPASE